MADQPAAGWYPDPNTPGQRRYWDGSKWTEHTDKKEEQQPQAAQPQAQAAQPQAQAAQPQSPVAQPQAAARPQAPAVQQPGGFQRPGGIQQQAGAVQSKPGQPGIGIAGFVCGLVGLILSLTVICWFIGLPLAIIGIVLSALGMRQANEKGAPKGLSMAGLILGIFGLVAGVAITVLVALA